jgi:cell division protein ZipA
MDNQFLIIAGILIFLLGVLLILKYNKRRHKRRSKMAERPGYNSSSDHDFDDQAFESQFDEQPDPLFDPPILTEVEEVADFDEIASEKTTPETIHEDEKDSPPPSPKKEERKPEMLIVLYVIAQQDSDFVGRDVLTVFEDVGLRYGKMDIFHHYGIGEIKIQKSIFSVASMVEPGTFKPERMSDFVTPGLVFFMRLPGPFGGRVAFELMLNNAHRIAEVLEGTILDEAHAQLDQKKITTLRERIANFEQHSPNLSMLKRFS